MRSVRACAVADQGAGGVGPRSETPGGTVAAAILLEAEAPIGVAAAAAAPEVVSSTPARTLRNHAPGAQTPSNDFGVLRDPTGNT